MIVRQNPIDESSLHPREDYIEDFCLFSDEDLRSIEEQCNFYYHNTGYAINGGNFMASLGDLAPLPGPDIRNPKGIRSPDEWMIAYYTMPQYIKDVFAFQTEIAIENMKLYKQAVGDKIQTIQISGNDFGTQRGEFISPDFFREFYTPYYAKMNQWVHQNTNWKTFYHSCGSIVNLLDDMVSCGWDVLNPVQCSEKGMDPRMLKEKHGKKISVLGCGGRHPKLVALRHSRRCTQRGIRKA